MGGEEDRGSWYVVCSVAQMHKTSSSSPQQSCADCSTELASMHAAHGQRA